MPPPAIESHDTPAQDHPVSEGSKGAESLLVRVPLHILASVMLFGVVLNSANVIARYFFNAPLFWAEEVLVYAMIWAVFLALPAITFNRDHLCMDLLYLALPKRIRAVVDAFSALLYVVFGSFAAYHAAKVVELLAHNRQASVTAELPMALVYAALPMGFALMVLATVVRCFGSSSRNKERTHP